MPVSTMPSAPSTPTLAGCVYPERFPEFVAAQVEQGTSVRELLEKPYKWDREYARFIAGVNVPSPKSGDDISDWLERHLIASGKSRSGGSMERPIEYRDVEFGTDTTMDVAQVVADFSDFDYMPTEGESFTFRPMMITAVGSEPITCKATAYPERKFGLAVVVFELEACR